MSTATLSFPRTSPQPPSRFFSRSTVGVLLLLLCSFALDGISAFKEPKTGVIFPDKFQGSAIAKTGVRTKGPIKVYAVGQYGDDKFLLQMTFGIGAEKMASAIKEALQPRCPKKDSDKVDKFESLMITGLPKGASKGTQLAFFTKGGKLAFQVNGKSIGSISSKPLAKAFAGIYTDKKAVCKMTPVVNNDNKEGDDDAVQETGSSSTLSKVVGAFLGLGVGLGVASVIQ